MRTNLYLAGILCLLLLAIPAFAQEDTRSLTFSHSLGISSGSAISQDRNGNIYLLDAKRNLVKLDSLGRPLVNFSPPTRGRVTAVEAWNPMKVLLFYEDRQELLLLDRFLRPIATTSLASYSNAGIIRAATLAPDDSFWLFNETNFTLSKLDNRSQTLSIETPLELVLDRERFDVRFVREYQNMVYLLDHNGGIYVFDNLGNYKKKLPFTGLSYMGFKGNELYFVKDNQLHFFDLYSLQQRTVALPADKALVTALASDNFLYLLSKNQLEVYTY